MNNLHTFNIQDISLLVLYLLGGFFLLRRFKGYADFRVRMVPYLMFLLHLLMTVVYYFFVLNGIGDAKGYYIGTWVLKSLAEVKPMSDGFIKTVLFPFVKYLQFSFFSAFLLFSFCSFVGFVLLYDVVIRLLKGFWTPWLLLFLLPSMHFWTSAIGKDALIFLGISWLCYNYFTGKKLISYLLPLMIVGLVRFYVLALIGVGIGVALVLLSRQLKLSYKILAMLVFSVAAFFIMPFFLQTIGVGEVSNITKQSEIVVSANQEGGGAVDLQGSNLAVKWFSYLFRPFIFEARSAQMLMAAVENVVWLVIFWNIFRGIRNTRWIPASRRTVFWIFVACIVTVTLPSAFILSNLGISSRQKIMIVPFMLILFYESRLALRSKGIGLVRT